MYRVEFGIITYCDYEEFKTESEVHNFILKELLPKKRIFRILEKCT